MGGFVSGRGRSHRPEQRSWVLVNDAIRKHGNRYTRTCISLNVSFVFFVKYSRKLYDAKDCDERSMLWYRLRMACFVGGTTADILAL